MADVLLAPADYWKLRALQTEIDLVDTQAQLRKLAARSAHAAFSRELAGRIDGYDHDGDYLMNDATESLVRRE